MPVLIEISLLLLIALVIRLGFIFIVPMVEAPDEFAHYWVIKFLTEHLRLPTAQEVFAGGPSAVYGPLPQLGYLPHALFSSLNSSEYISLFGRFGSLLMGLILITIAYFTGKEIFPQKRHLALALPIIMIFHPQLAFVHSYANVDATTITLSGLALYLTILQIKYGLSYKRTFATGITCGAMALCKYNAGAIFPSIFTGILAAGIIHGTTLITIASHFLAIGVLMIAMSAWWFVRNLSQYPGDMLGTKTMYKIWAETFHREMNYYQTPWQIIKEKRWWRTVFFSFWGLFGYMNKYMPRPLYITYLVFFIGSVAGLINNLLGIVNNLFSKTPESSQTSIAKQHPIITNTKSYLKSSTFMVWLIMFISIATNCAAMIYASTLNLGGPQGRYFFTSEIPLIAFLILGLSSLGEKIKGEKLGKQFVLGFCIYNAITCLIAWGMLFSLYGFHAKPY